MKEDDQLPAALQHFKRLVDARVCDLGCDAGIRTFLLVTHFFVRSSHSGTLAYIQEASETRKARLASLKKELRSISRSLSPSSTSSDRGDRCCLFFVHDDL